MARIGRPFWSRAKSNLLLSPLWSSSSSDSLWPHRPQVDELWSNWRLSLTTHHPAYRLIVPIFFAPHLFSYLINQRRLLHHPPDLSSKSGHSAPVLKMQKTPLINWRLSLAIPAHKLLGPGNSGSNNWNTWSDTSCLFWTEFVFLPLIFLGYYTIPLVTTQPKTRGDLPKPSTNMVCEYWSRIYPKSDGHVGRYLNPPKSAVVLAADEKPSLQVLERPNGDVKTRHKKIMHGFKSTYQRHETLTVGRAQCCDRCN